MVWSAILSSPLTKKENLKYKAATIIIHNKIYRYYDAACATPYRLGRIFKTC